MANEIELKLAFPATALAAILAHPLLAGAPRKGEPRLLDNTYFDTPDLRLHAERVAVRTRTMGNTILQTIKCAADSAGGLSSRPEWEQAFNQTFDFAAVDHKSVRKLLEGVSEQLLPVFTTLFQRETRIVQPVPEVCILVMIDTGKVIVGDKESPICEVELELAQGGAHDLLNFAITLAEDLPLVPFDLSKAQRGYQLFRAETIKPCKFGKTPVIQELTPLGAFRAIAMQLQHGWQANLHGALENGDAEFIHQFRVSLRRLKTLLKLCKPILPESFVNQWSATFSSLASASGDTRDLDVLSQSILQPILCSESENAIELLMRRNLLECAQARVIAQKSFASLSHGLHLLKFFQAVRDLKEEKNPEKLGVFARRQLKRLRKRADRRLDAVQQNPTPEMIHRLRISCKNLRYSCEFFAPLFDAASIHQFNGALAELQDELGFLHDLDVALNRLSQWAEDDPQLTDARNFVANWHADRARKTLKSIQDKAPAVLSGALLQH